MEKKRMTKRDEREILGKRNIQIRWQSKRDGEKPEE